MNKHILVYIFLQFIAFSNYQQISKAGWSKGKVVLSAQAFSYVSIVKPKSQHQWP